MLLTDGDGVEVYDCASRASGDSSVVATVVTLVIGVDQVKRQGVGGTIFGNNKSTGEAQSS